MSAVSITGSPNTPVLVPVSHFVGEDVTITDTISSTGTGAGATVNIAGWALTFVLKKKYGDGSALVQKTVGAGITITNGAGGVFTVQIAAADTNGLTSPQDGEYNYQIFRSDSGNNTMLSYGTYTLEPRL